MKARRRIRWYQLETGEALARLDRRRLVEYGPNELAVEERPQAKSSTSLKPLDSAWRRAAVAAGSTPVRKRLPCLKPARVVPLN